LKALAIVRLVSEQADADCRGAWTGESFRLQTVLNEKELQDFFLEQYRPTPIVAPWNGGSGFYPKDNRTAIERITEGSAPRFSSYQHVIQRAADALRTLRVDDKIDKDTKPLLLELCRARFPDSALEWLDAAYLLAGDNPKYPPLLGTGGNDGRLDFTNNFMQRLLDLVDPDNGAPTPESPALLRTALFDEPTDSLTKGAIGQFLPGGAGGPNAETGFTAESLINPWDFVLMLEGALLFAVAATRRFEHDTTGALSYPFTVHQTGIGYPSAADADESAARAEMWLPLWDSPTSARELRRVLAEGRATVGKRAARNGLDFARAVATLGVDRGISEFQRIGFQVRNGLSYLATPLDRMPVRAQANATLLQPLDDWLDAFRKQAGSDRAPAAARRALRRLQNAIFDLCRQTGSGPEPVQEVLLALGQCERTMARSLRWTTESRLRPVPPLDPTWLSYADDGSVEFRLAAGLASVGGSYRDRQGRPQYVPLRRHMEPVQTNRTDDGLRARWDDHDPREVAWIDGKLIESLHETFRRRLLLASDAGASSWRDRSRVGIDLGDLTDFLDAQCDDRRIENLLWGCSLVDWSRPPPSLTRRTPADEPRPPALFALLKLCFPNPGKSADAASPDGSPTGHSRTAEGTVRGQPMPIVPTIHRHAAAGRGSEAARGALRRLRGCSLSAAIDALYVQGERSERVAAALVWSLTPAQIEQLASRVLVTSDPTSSEAQQTATGDTQP
jgi:CRISPR-associated protein Csx17